jgi:hypothetical protein
MLEGVYDKETCLQPGISVNRIPTPTEQALRVFETVTKALETLDAEHRRRVMRAVEVIYEEAKR